MKKWTTCHLEIHKFSGCWVLSTYCTIHMHIGGTVTSRHDVLTNEADIWCYLFYGLLLCAHGGLRGLNTRGNTNGVVQFWVILYIYIGITRIWHLEQPPHCRKGSLNFIVYLILSFEYHKCKFNSTKSKF